MQARDFGPVSGSVLPTNSLPDQYLTRPGAPGRAQVCKIFLRLEKRQAAELAKNFTSGYFGPIGRIVRQRAREANRRRLAELVGGPGRRNRERTCPSRSRSRSTFRAI
jgi:hypothetical protein